MNVAIIADWLTTYGGAEHTIAEFCRVFPTAPIFTTVARPEKLGPLANTQIHTTPLQRWYSIVHNHQVLLPWMPKALEGIDVRGYDCILSSSHAVGKGIIPPSTAIHACYCHTPMRYAWEMENTYLDDFRIPKRLRPSIRRMLKRLRRWDMTTAKRVDQFLCNSSETKERIARIYNREAIVIPPPVDDVFFEEVRSKKQEIRNGQEYYLALGRLVPYKKFDLLIETANALKLPLVIAGTGQEEKRLKKMAGPTVTFLGFVPDEEVPSLYAQAKAFLFPVHEDAGIAPREALAMGTPVIAYGHGGVLDAVTEDATGIFFKEQTLESLADAIERFGKQSWDRNAIRASAKGFTRQLFQNRIREEVGVAFEKYGRKGKA